jgi:hypothetical protein
LINEIKGLFQLQELISRDEVVYFRLTGGLGNQLFGLSEAYGIHKNLGKRLAIDIGAIEHTTAEGPEWLKWSKNQNWMTLIRIPKHVSSDFELVNLGEKTEYLDFRDFSLYTGWKFSLKNVLEAGLFQKGKFPFENLGSQANSVSIHYRVGDYTTAPGIGILGISYYKKALREIRSGYAIEIFSDDNEAASTLIESLGLENATINNSRSALDVLGQISNSKCIVASNSTLSWWAIFFSNANTAVCPTPFYLQDWNFDTAARFSKALYLSRFDNRVIGFVIRLLWQYRSFKIRIKS